MKKLLYTLLACATIGTASADLRIFNGTTDDIVVDVLSQAGQQRDVLIPGRTMSEVIGAKRVPANTKEIVVYKDKSGNEISRDEYWSGSVFIFGYHSDTSFRKDGFYKFDKAQNQDNLVFFINNTGSRVDTKYETPDFEIQESYLYGPDNSAPGVFKRNQALSGYINVGDSNVTREMTFTCPAFDGPQKASVSTGCLYVLDAVDGKLKVTKI